MPDLECLQKGRPGVDTPQTHQDLHSRTMLFPNGNRALLLAPPAGTSAADILHVLGIGHPKALLLVVGGTAELDEAVQPRLVQLCSRGIARAADSLGALIMDGGTHAGVMAMIGQGVADRGRKTALIGVAPAGKVTYPDGPADGSIAQGAALDPNHSHFVLVESCAWGGELETMYAMAAALATTVPVVTVLINGGPLARDEVLQSVRHGWAIIVVQDSGRLADEIATLWQAKPPFIADPVLAEIIADGVIHLFPLDGEVAALEDLITRRVRGDNTLKLAWERFALYDANAGYQQASFRTLQWCILALGVLGTLLALTHTELKPKISADPIGQIGLRLLHAVIVIVPVTMAILVAAANRFNAGNKWVVLRASAEAIKKEHPDLDGWQVTVKEPRIETWCCGWFNHHTIDRGQDDLAVLASFERFVNRTQAAIARGDATLCVMSAEDRWRWRGKELGDQAPCRCDGRKQCGLIRINY
jgi:hypothetical protein